MQLAESAALQNLFGGFVWQLLELLLQRSKLLLDGRFIDTSQLHVTSLSAYACNLLSPRPV